MKLNANIMHGAGKLETLSDVLVERGFKRPGIICDKNLLEHVPYVSLFIERMKKAGVFVHEYDYGFEPSYQYLDNLMAHLTAQDVPNNVDVWVGVGGGSVLDVAKGLAILCKNEGPALSFKGFPTNLVEPLPVIAVPSTTGTGSEVAFNASFIDEVTQVKMGINYEKNYPILAILDPKVVELTPRAVLASSGCDALVHALESFVSTEATRQSRVFSAHAFELIMKNMPPLLQGEGTLTHWENMQWAAVYAMFALSNTTSGPTGALSYYLGTHFEVPHGIAGGVFIAKVSKHNHARGYFDYARLYDAKSMKPAESLESKSEAVVLAIQSLVRLANMPNSLAEVGVQEADKAGFKAFAKQAEAAFRFNPIAFSEHELDALLQ
jgi:alcohol dehydrogenase class IV